MIRLYMCIDFVICLYEREMKIKNILDETNLYKSFLGISMIPNEWQKQIIGAQVQMIRICFNFIIFCSKYF